MVVKAFRDKCHPLGDKGLEWYIYHGLKWCLSPTKVLIIQSEEELPGHYLHENNNVNTRLPGLPQYSLSELVSCSTIHSISTTPSSRIHSFSLLIDSLFLQCLTLPPSVLQDTPPSLPNTLQASAAPTPPPYLVLMSHCEIQADGWGTKG